MARGDLIQRLARRDHQHVHRVQTQATRTPLRRHQCAHLVEPFEQFDVRLQIVDKGTVEHMPADLRQARRSSADHARQLGIGFELSITADTDHQHATGPQVQGRADRRRLAYRAVAEVFAVDLHRREYQRNRRTGQQVFEAQPRRHPDTTVTKPGVDGRAALIEGHRLTAFIAEGRHRHGPQLSMTHGSRDTGEVQLALQQLTQRRTVEQGHRNIAPQAKQAVANEARRLPQHARPVAAVHHMGVKALPDRGQAPHGFAELQRPTGQANGIDRPGRGPNYHRKGIVRGVRQ